MSHPSVLIVGAGPTGLTTAIELARRNIPVQIIEKKQSPEKISKAVGINPNSLTLLEASGVTERLLAQGLRMAQLNFHLGPSQCFKLNFQHLQYRYPFMLLLPQDETENILSLRLEALGVKVQRDTEFLSFERKNRGEYFIQVCDQEKNRRELRANLMVAADGAHSTLRKQLGIDFEGHTIETPWYLADVCMDWTYAEEKAGHAFLEKTGIITLIIPLREKRYRIVSNHPIVLTDLPAAARVSAVQWEAEFRLSCRLARQYQVDQIYLAGDAAHIHTPVGGRGMNLGIEDACFLAKCIAKGPAALAEYTAQRRPIAKGVIQLTSRLYHLLTVKNPYAIWGRNTLLFPLLQSTWVQKKMVYALSGLPKKRYI